MAVTITERPPPGAQREDRIIPTVQTLLDVVVADICDALSRLNFRTERHHVEVVGSRDVASVHGIRHEACDVQIHLGDLSGGVIRHIRPGVRSVLHRELLYVIGDTANRDRTYYVPWFSISIQVVLEHDHHLTLRSPGPRIGAAAEEHVERAVVVAWPRDARGGDVAGDVQARQCRNQRRQKRCCGSPIRVLPPKLYVRVSFYI